MACVAADESSVAVDHQFRSVDPMISEPKSVSLLTLRPLAGGKGIGPTFVVPVVDMLFQRYDFRPHYRLLFFQSGKQSVRRGATRAAFRCEEFQDHRHSHGSAACVARRLGRSQLASSGYNKC